MTLSEFKAWFEGFTDGIEGAPTEDQFAKIKAKVADIDGAPVTYPIYVDRYVPTIIGYPNRPYGWGDINTGYTTGQLTTIDAVGRNEGVGVCNFAQTTAFDSHAAMRALGRAEASN